MEELIQKNAAQATKSQNKANTLAPFPTRYPGGVTPDTLFDSRTEKIIRAQADRMVSTGCFQQFERDDIANDLRVLLAYEMVHFNPAVSDRYVFAATILAKRGINDIIRRSAELRENPRPMSLDEPVGSDGSTHLDHISQEDYDASIGNRQHSEEWKEKAEKQVALFMASLCPDDQLICTHLMNGLNPHEISLKTGMSPATLHYRLRIRIRKAAEAFGLDRLFGGEAK